MGALKTAGALTPPYPTPLHPTPPHLTSLDHLPARQEGASKASGQGIDTAEKIMADLRPDGMVWTAMQAGFEPDASAQIIYRWGQRKGKAAIAPNRI